MNMEPKEIRLTGATNVRLLADGIIRADSLDRLTGEDIAVLTRQYKLKTIIDLRTETEIRERPDKEISGVAYLKIPLMEEQTAGITRESGTEPASIASHLPDMPSLYRKMVSEPFCLDALSRILNIVLSPDKHTVLFHCTAGKDRTGIVSLLVLSSLGHSEDYIVKEYLRSNQVAIPAAEETSKAVLHKTGDRRLAAKIREVFVADAAYLSAAIDEIRKRCGSVKDFADKLLKENAERG